MVREDATEARPSTSSACVKTSQSLAIHKAGWVSAYRIAYLQSRHDFSAILERSVLVKP